MQNFVDLYQQLDETTKTNRKVAALQDYFSVSSPADAIWAIYFLTGRKLSRLVKTSLLKSLTIELTQTPEWLFNECYDIVGDLAETIALLIPESSTSHHISLHELVEDVMQPLKHQSTDDQKQAITRLWNLMTSPQRFVLNKLITGSFRVGVSEKLVVRGLAEAFGLSPKVLAHRLMGEWEPTVEFYQSIISKDGGEGDLSRPYPFCLANPLQADPQTLGPSSAWIAEWKWDGIRAQMIKRNNKVFLWSRGEELINPQFPELEHAAQALPNGTVIDGEVLIWKNERPSTFVDLQQRLGRKKVSAKLQKALPVCFMAFDLIEFQYHDWREKAFSDRRHQLEQLLHQLPHISSDKPSTPSLFPELESPQSQVMIQLAQTLDFDHWENLAITRQRSREHGVEGVMLKHRDSHYEVGRVAGGWWKWKIDPYTVDAVLIYAQRGHGRRASLYSDYTFGVWDGGQLVPFAKAYSGLTDEEMRKVDKYVREHTVGKFGPVRHVTPSLVFELAFENVQLSGRHKSGVAVRFPRMSRWRTDKTPEQADTLDNVKQMLQQTTSLTKDAT